MNAVEDRMRDALAHVDIPDVPVPAIEALQRRAKRHRLNQASGALGSMVVVVMCIFGGMSFAGGTSGSLSASGIQRIKSHIAGIRGPQWLVAKQTLDGHTYTAASTNQGGEPCVDTSDGFGTCNALGAGWQYNAIGDFGSGGSNNTSEFAGRVPLDAAEVTITYGGHTVTTPAVHTPTSDVDRYFAAFFPSSDLQIPIVGVVDTAGRPIAAPGGAPAQRTATQLSHVAGLPTRQYALQSDRAGWQLDGFKQHGNSCLSLRGQSGSAPAPSCLSAVPSQATPVAEIQLPDGQTVVAGDAPSGVTGVALARGGFENQVATVALPGDNSRVFWSMTVPTVEISQQWLIASCSAGWNCWQTRSLNLSSSN